MTESTAQPVTPMSPLNCACARCGRSAGAGRDFCGGCGARLWEPCVGCGERNSVAERFCNHCGGELQPLLDAALADIERRAAESLAAESAGDLLAAAECLRDLPASKHSVLATRLDELRERHDSLAERRTEAVATKEARLAQALQLRDRRQYAEAYATLEQVPAALRDLAARKLLAELKGVLDEIAILRARLKQGLAEGPSPALLPAAERLLALQPDAGDVQRLCNQLRELTRQRNAVTTKTLLKKARDAMAGNRYRFADDVVRQLPTFKIDDEQQQKLLEAIAERLWLARQISSAPFADRKLLAIAARLAKLQPEDAQARTLLDEMRKRLARAAQESASPFAAWRAPEKPADPLGAPVEAVYRLSNIQWDLKNPRLGDWSGTSRQQFVAIGLALQGLGAARLGLELQSRSKSLLGRVASASRKRKPRAAWGLDCGASGVKLVRLVQEGDKVVVDQSHLLACDAPQIAERGPDGPERLAPALKDFVEQFGASDEPVVVGFPGNQTLARFFELPKLQGKKRQASIDYEVRNQIPLPVHEVRHAEHIWEPVGSHPPEDEGPAPCFILVTAAKSAHVDQWRQVLDGIKGLGWTLQSELVALSNLLLHTHPEEIAELAPGEAIALIEVGSSSTNVIAASSRRGPWFRSIHRGLGSLNKRLVAEFGVTWQQADELRQFASLARPWAEIDAALRPGLDELTREVGLTLQTYANTTGHQVVKIYLAGGGCEQFGLARAWAGATEDGHEFSAWPEADEQFPCR